MPATLRVVEIEASQGAGQVLAAVGVDAAGVAAVDVQVSPDCARAEAGDGFRQARLPDQQGGSRAGECLGRRLAWTRNQCELRAEVRAAHRRGGLEGLEGVLEHGIHLTRLRFNLN